nr:atrial natriuretic peptide-converting enzyme-like isoform X1 [Microcebus murinus]
MSKTAIATPRGSTAAGTGAASPRRGSATATRTAGTSPTRPTASCHSQGLVECRNGQCVPSAFQCDGDEDCKDGSDEENCSNSQTPCQEGDQRCLHSSCLDSCGGSSLCERNNSLNNCSKCHS